MTEVLELPHVALEVERDEILQCRFGQALGFDAEFLRALREEMPGQQRDVLAPLAQRRQADADDVEPVERSSRNRPSLTRVSRFWCVAAMTRTLALIGEWPPTR